MSIRLIKSQHYIAKEYDFPETGKVKLYLESTQPLDIFLVSYANADSIEKKNKFLNLDGDVFQKEVTKVINVTFKASDSWKPKWKLILFNYGKKDAAVYFKVREGGDSLEGIFDDSSSSYL